MWKWDPKKHGIKKPILILKSTQKLNSKLTLKSVSIIDKLVNIKKYFKDSNKNDFIYQHLRFYQLEKYLEYSKNVV